MISKNKFGFMMLEMVLYLSLFSFIVGSSVLTFYQLSESNHKLSDEISVVDEAEFILKKINWLTSSFEILKEPIKNNQSHRLHLVKNSSDYFIYEIDGIVYLKKGDDVSSLSSEQFEIKNLIFESLSLDDSQNFFGIKSSFEIKNDEFKIIRFNHAK